MNGLRERAVLVTGAASGIGEATCERLAAEGAWVALLDRDMERLATVAARLAERGARSVALPADVAREDQVGAAVDGAVAAFGHLGGVVTCAGIFRPGDRQLVADVDLDTFERTLAVNLVGTFLVVRHALPHLLETRGAIVTIASTAGLRGHGFGAGYTASKGGVIALTRLLAFQYGERGVRANCICPGATDTPMTGGVWQLPERVAQLKKTVPLGRAAEPAEIGNVACFLVSDDASYVNGQIVAVDGGGTVN